MKNTNTFQLEAAIATWRDSLDHGPVMSKEDLDELEQHVRDQVSHLVQQGLTEKLAFDEAMKTVGPRSDTHAAYSEVYWGKLKRDHRLKDEIISRASMIANYAKVAFRNLYKQKGYAFINIFGLSIGLACFILISLFVQFELSFDKYHENADQTYRIIKQEASPNQLGPYLSAATPAPLLPALNNEFPEVEHATQIVKANALLEFQDKKFYEEGLFATEGLFDVFSFKVLAGDPKTALTSPNGIILTASLSEKYFGKQDPTGQTLTVSHTGEDFGGKIEMTVAGVIEDVPSNSHFDFDYIVSVLSSNELDDYFEAWYSNSYLTYAVLLPGHSISAFHKKLSALARQHLSQLPNYQEHPEEISHFVTEPLTDIHLKSDLYQRFEDNGDIKYVYLFSFIAFLILLIACINYINLSTARSAKRAMEVGVRKAMGAHRSQLIGQFMSESVLPSILALGIAVVFVILFLPTFGALISRDLALNISENGGFLLLLLAIGLGVGILAGGYPALMMSSFHPVSMMKGVLNQTAGKTTLRNSLVVAQFSITIALIIGSIVIQQQLHFFQNTNTGIARNQIISIKVDDKTLYEKYPALKQALQSHPNVVQVAAAQQDPINIDSATPAREWEGVEEGQSILVNRIGIGHDFLDLFDVELVEGRNFSKDMGTDENSALLINETLKHQLGWDSAVGKRLNFRDRDHVIGVTKDFNFLPLNREMAPLAIYLDTQGWFPFQRVFVKLGPGEMKETVTHLQNTFAEFSPDFPFVYHFLDDVYNNMYQTEQRLGSLLSYFTFLALFIACLGLLGLAALTAQQRTKEIGVRKVLGASQTDILILLSKDFTRLVLFAFILGAPIGYLTMNRWLQEFAYSVSLGPGILILAGSVVLVTAWLTVSYQSMRAAGANPVHSLRQE